MGVIQGSINQLLTTAGVAARLSPGLEERQKVLNLEKQYSKLGEVQEKSDFSEHTVEEIAKQQTNIAKEIATLKPTEKNVQRYAIEAEGLSEMQKDTAKQRARQDLLKKQREKERSENFRKITEGVPEIQWQQLKTMQK